MRFTFKIWCQESADASGEFRVFAVEDVSPDSSLLETLDKLNDDLEARGDQPVAFDSDCREGICGACSLVVNGHAHGKGSGKTSCQIYMREFSDGETITLEPWRADAFPLVRDLIVDRGAFDRIIQAGGYVSVNTGAAPDANAIPVSKESADSAMDAAQCIGCGACVAACKNASAMLFVSAKVSHLGLLPQGQPERNQRVLAMVDQMDSEGFGNCTNEYECEAHCPKNISVTYIAQMNRDFVRAKLSGSRSR